jgi:predicted Zn-dependent protease
MTTLTGDDSQRAFQDYMADAQKRFTHDQQFPEEPKQLRPGEDIQMTENRVQVSGQVAVMAINEKLLETLMSKNPGLSFALQESFPFKSTYPDAAPLGPIMELRAQDGQTTFTANAAAQALDYWRITTQQLPIGSETSEDQEVLRAYSKLATAQAGLLAAHNFNAEAEQTYRFATEICPYNPEAVFSYVNLLVTQQRFAEAVPVVETAVRAAPDNQQLHDLLDTLKKRVKGK